MNGNGIDDEREMQANMYQALINTMTRYPGLVNGVLWTEIWIASDQKWAEHWGKRRGFSIRDKPSEDVVRKAHESWGEWLSGGHWMRVSADMRVDEAGAFVDAPELVGRAAMPSSGSATYRGVATGGYAVVYGEDVIGKPAGSHEIGDYEGDVQLTADFAVGRIRGHVESIEARGFLTRPGQGTQPFNGASLPHEIILETTGFTSNGFTGSTSVTSTESDYTVTSSNGSWGGKFSTIPDSDSNPRLIAGTHGATFIAAGGTEGSFIGVFVGTSDQRQ